MNKKTEKRIRLKKKIRIKILGTEKHPRLSVFRSNNYIYAQLINDLKKETLISASDVKLKTGTKIDHAKLVGVEIAKKAIAIGVKKVIFDRNGFKYTGRIKVLADSARESGLEF